MSLHPWDIVTHSVDQDRYHLLMKLYTEVRLDVISDLPNEMAGRVADLRVLMLQVRKNQR